MAAHFIDPCDDMLDALAHARNPGEPSPFDSDEPDGEFDNIDIAEISMALRAECYDAERCREFLIEDAIKNAENGDQKARDTLDWLRRLPALVRGAGVRS